MERFELHIEAESRIRWKVYVRFGGEFSETDHSNMARRRLLSLQQGLLYAFSMMSLYGRGERWAWTMDYNWKKRLTFQVKWGWTHYRDRSTISSGAEEIQGNNKYDLQFQVRLKW